jgi:ribosomal protein S18 acetylase RimI-like enzyme
MLKIEIYRGPRDALACSFAEADESASRIAEYRDLGDVLVASSSGTIIGHAQLVEGPECGAFELKSLAVDESWRSNGVGSALVDAAFAHCRERDGRLLVVATAAASIDALKFYQRLGFRMRRIIRDFYTAERGYGPSDINGIPLLDEVILDLSL